MPIYEYQCENCGHQFEALQKFSDEPIRVCPKCDQPSVQKLVSAAGFQLKGSGWYLTDYKSSNKPKDEGSNNSSSGTDAAPTKTNDSASKS